MADIHSILDVFRAPIPTEDEGGEERRAAIIEMLAPLLREDATATQKQAEHLFLTIQYFVVKGEKPSPIEVCALAAFVNSCG